MTDHISRPDGLKPEPRKAKPREPAGQLVDVTRLEHENLCSQMDQVLQMLRRIELELVRQGERITRLEDAGLPTRISIPRAAAKS